MRIILLLIPLFSSTLTANEFMVDTSFTLSPAWGKQELPAVAFGSGEFLCVWVDYRENEAQLYASRVSTTGKVIDSTGIRVNGSEGYYVTGRPDVAFGDSIFLVVFSEQESIYGVRISSENEVIGKPVSIGRGFTPCVAYAGTNFCVAWTCSTGLKVARVNSSGKVLDQGGILVSQESLSPQQIDIAFCRGYDFIVGQADHGDMTGLDIVGFLLKFVGDSVVTKNITVYQSPDADINPSITASGDKFMIIFFGGWDTRGSVYSYDGEFIDDFELRAGGSAYMGCCASNKYFLTVWSGYGGIFVKRTDIENLIVDNDEIQITETDAANVSVDFGNSTFIITYGNNNIEGIRLDSEGQKLDESPFTISFSGNSQFIEDIAFNGNTHLLTWADWRGDTTEVLGVLAPLYSSSRFSLFNSNSIPSVSTSSHNTEFLIALKDQYSLYAVRLDNQGKILSKNLLKGSWFADKFSLTEGTNSYILLRGIVNIWEDPMEGNYYWDSFFGSEDIDFSGSAIQARDTLMKTSDEPYYGQQLAPFLAVAQGTDCFGIAFGLSDSNYRYFRRMDLKENILDSGSVKLPLAPVGIAFRNDIFLLVAQRDSSIIGARVSATGNLIDSQPFEIVTGTFCDMTSIRNGFLIIFTQQNFLKGAILNMNRQTVENFDISYLKSPIAAAKVNPGKGDTLLVSWSQFVGPPYNSYRLFGTYFVKTGIAEAPSSKPLSDFEMSSFHPNPFSNATTVRLNLFNDAPVSLTIYDASGRVTKKLVSGELRKGSYQFVWHGDGERGEKVSSGVYFYHLTVNNQIRIGKIVVVQH
jgi:hypothetical protein